MVEVVLAEDEPRAVKFIKKGLSGAGMSVESCEDLDELDIALKTRRYDVLVLDRLLKDKDSLSYLQRIKQLAPDTSVLMLTALSDVDQRVSGLDSGADDYLGKPFHLSELISRINNLARRRQSFTASPRNPSKSFKNLEMNLDTRKVKRAGQNIELTPKEFRLLLTFINAPKKVFTREELLDRVWDMNFSPESNVVTKTIERLRKKVNENQEEKLIHAHRGIGYSLIDED